MPPSPPAAPCARQRRASGAAHVAPTSFAPAGASRWCVASSSFSQPGPGADSLSEQLWPTHKFLCGRDPTTFALLPFTRAEIEELEGVKHMPYIADAARSSFLDFATVKPEATGSSSSWTVRTRVVASPSFRSLTIQLSARRPSSACSPRARPSMKMSKRTAPTVV